MQADGDGEMVMAAGIRKLLRERVQWRVRCCGDFVRVYVAVSGRQIERFLARFPGVYFVVDREGAVVKVERIGGCSASVGHALDGAVLE